MIRFSLLDGTTKGRVNSEGVFGTPKGSSSNTRSQPVCPLPQSRLCWRLLGYHLIQLCQPTSKDVLQRLARVERALNEIVPRLHIAIPKKICIQCLINRTWKIQEKGHEVEGKWVEREVLWLSIDEANQVIRFGDMDSDPKEFHSVN